MDQNKKAAITTCARAALSSLNKTLNREIVNTNNNCNLEASWCSGKTALLRRYFCLRLKGAGARVSLFHRGRSVRRERGRVALGAGNRMAVRLYPRWTKLNGSVRPDCGPDWKQ